MIPKLQRYYGGHPNAWLYDVPVALLRAYAKQMLSEQAQEELTMIESVAVGAGSMEKQRRSSVIRRLQRAVDDRPAKPAEPDELRALGITVEEV